MLLETLASGRKAFLTTETGVPSVEGLGRVSVLMGMLNVTSVSLKPTNVLNSNKSHQTGL
jgi:hypothetical protein